MTPATETAPGQFKAMEGTWILCAPNGAEWSADSPLACLRAEMNDRIPATVQMARIFAELDEDATERAPAERDALAFALQGHIRTLRLSGRNDGLVEDMQRAADVLAAAPAGLEAAPPVETLRQALEKIAATMSSDWPERCIENVRIARAALASSDHAASATSGGGSSTRGGA